MKSILFLGRIFSYYFDCSFSSERKMNLIFVFFKGEQLGQTEATETFFAMTKLFQSKDVCSSKKESLQKLLTYETR